MAKRQTIGENPLDGLITTTLPSSNTDTSFVNKKQDMPKQKKESSPKQRITVQIRQDIIERLKNAVYWTPGLTLAALSEEAFAKAVDKLEEDRREKFPQRREELKTGRPVL